MADETQLLKVTTTLWAYLHNLPLIRSGPPELGHAGSSLNHTDSSRIIKKKKKKTPHGPSQSGTY